MEQVKSMHQQGASNNLIPGTHFHHMHKTSSGQLIRTFKIFQDAGKRAEGTVYTQGMETTSTSKIRVRVLQELSGILMSRIPLGSTQMK